MIKPLHLLPLILLTLSLLFPTQASEHPTTASEHPNTSPEHHTNNTHHEEEEEENEESIASLSILLMLTLLICTYLIGYALHSIHFKYLHEAGVAILLGIFIGAVVRFSASPEKMRSALTFDAEFFFLALLPPIIFESGYNMKRGRFFYNIGSIMVYAMFGTMISMFVIGGLLYAVSHHLRWTSTDLDIYNCMIFGALISATDPVTVLSLFSSLNVEKNLYANVFGESVFNDAIAIVLYRTMVKFALEPITNASYLIATVDFFKVLLGSVAIGIGVALLSALLFKHMHLEHEPIVELALLILFAFGSYCFADGLKLSGIVAILFCGITMAHYTFNNLSSKSQKISKKLFKVLALTCETFVFVYLGLAVFAYDPLNQQYDIGFITLSFPIILVARAVNIFPLSCCINTTRSKKHKVDCNAQIMLWFSGLRGAIAFTLALDVPTPAKSVIFSTTVIIVLFTVLVFGGLTVPVLRCLRIRMGKVDKDKNEEVEFSKTNKFLLLDRKYMKSIFTKKGDKSHHKNKDVEKHPHKEEQHKEPEQPIIITTHDDTMVPLEEIKD